MANHLLQTDDKPLLVIFGSIKGIPSHTADFRDRVLYYSITILKWNTLHPRRSHTLMVFRD